MDYARMMHLSNSLKSLSTDDLRYVATAARELLSLNARNEMRVGSYAKFIDKRGVERFVRIVKINQKTVSADEVTSQGVHHTGMGKWRVGMPLLSPYQPEPMRVAA